MSDISTDYIEKKKNTSPLYISGNKTRDLYLHIFQFRTFQTVSETSSWQAKGVSTKTGQAKLSA